MNRTSMLADRSRIGARSEARPNGTPRSRRLLRGKSKLAVLAFSGLLIGVLLVALIPAESTSASPGKTGGTCNGPSGGCHPVTSSSFLTVTGFPGSGYVPNQAYSITVEVADTNGWITGENGFDLILSTGGGVLTSTDPNVNIVSATEAAIEDAVNTTARQWTLTWTAPASGDVTVNTWAVYGDGSGKNSPYEHQTLNVGAGAIPEFSVVLLPIIGMIGAVILASRVAKKSKN